MKSLTSKLMVAAVAMAAVASVASAQSMKVEVPFSFKVNGTAMAAGTYDVRAENNMSGSRAFRLVNVDSHRPVMVMPVSSHNAGAEWMTQAKLVFRCASATCSLAQIWTGSSDGAYDFRTPKNRESAAYVVVPITSKAD